MQYEVDTINIIPCQVEIFLLNIPHSQDIPLFWIFGMM